ncbi:MAG TPA: nucleotide sugar dehydrogenase [Candidatus Bathyarchaeia archaeon]|nr:nucleotide sugar dehydrogenase [Candidatus Bathyarchaeia archaeon]
MSTVLHLSSEEINTIEKRGKYTVSVIGCGQKGVLYATALAEAGFKVICTDADQSLVRRLAKGKALFSEREVEAKLKNFMRTGQLSATNELKSAVSQSDIIIMTITAKIDDRKNPDYSEAESSCKQVGAALRRGALVIYGGIASFGFTEGIIKETLENTSGLRVGEDFGLAYNPLQIPDGQLTESISNQELTVAANDETSLNAASTVLGTITKKGVKQILDVKTAELAALFAVARRDANVALANELAVLCENAGMDYFEIFRLLVPDTREISFVPTIAEEDSRNEAYLLLETAENLNTKLRLTALARQINETMVRHAVNLTQDVLRSCGKTLRRARVAVLGTTGPKTTADTFVKMLETKGAKVSIYDPLLSKNEPSDMTRALKRSLNEAVEGTDCIVILTEHDQFKRLNLKKLRAVMKMPAAIVDLTGTIEPQKVEKEGFTYRGLGRGTGKK